MVSAGSRARLWPLAMGRGCLEGGQRPGPQLLAPPCPPLCPPAQLPVLRLLQCLEKIWQQSNARAASTHRSALRERWGAEGATGASWAPLGRCDPLITLDLGPADL